MAAFVLFKTWESWVNKTHTLNLRILSKQKEKKTENIYLAAVTTRKEKKTCGARNERRKKIHSIRSQYICETNIFLMQNTNIFLEENWIKIICKKKKLAYLSSIYQKLLIKNDLISVGVKETFIFTINQIYTFLLSHPLLLPHPRSQIQIHPPPLSFEQEMNNAID